MAKQVTQSVLAKKYGNKIGQAVKEHAADPVNYGRISLPAGIKNGVAKLAKCYFAQYESGDNKGEYYFRAEGVVVLPKSITVDGQDVTIQGRHTSYMEPICATKKGDGSTVSIEEHVDSIMNEMKKLGGEFDESGAAEQLESVAAALQETGPYFGFSTSVRAAREYYDSKTKTKKMSEEGVWENWHGNRGLEDFVPPEDAGVEDSTASPTDEAPAESQPDDATGDVEASEGSGGDEREQALAEALETANDDPPNPGALVELAKEAGMNDKQINAAASWDDVADTVRASWGDDSNGAVVLPEKGMVYKYLPPKAKKPIEIDVDAVDKKAETVAAHSIDNPKLKYKAIPFAELIVD